MELISILMPAYNVENYIAESIQSVIDQTYTNWELLIVNDGSTDKTKVIAEEYSKRDLRIKVINQDNKRLGAARNTGIQHSKGTWIAFLDSDDLWESVKLEKQINISNDYPVADVIYTNGSIFQSGNLTDQSNYTTITGRLIGPQEMYKLEYKYNYIAVLSVLVKASVIQKIGLQEENKYYFGCEDWDYWLRMAIAGANFYGMPEKLFFYRRHNNNMSGNGLNMLLANVSVLIKNFDVNFISKREATAVLKKSTYPLIVQLIKEVRFADIYYIINKAESILPSLSHRIIKRLVNLLGRKSLIPVLIVCKVDKMKKT